MVLALTQNTSRQREILEIVLGNGWGYMRGLLTGGTKEEPQIPPPEALRNILVELGPVYVKLGQLLSTRPDLMPPSYIEALTALQAKVPTVPWKDVESLIRQQLSKPLDEVFATINTTPIAAGSIAQIYRATLNNGQEVAMKVQRPGIEKIVRQDTALIKAIAELVSATEFGQDYDIVSLADEFTSALKAELDFTKEAAYTEQLRRNLAQSRWFDARQLVIPAIYKSLTTEKLLVMEWLEGKPILDAEIHPADGKTGGDLRRRQQIATLLFRAFFQQMYIDGFFHADPHPGNIFYLQSDRVALIDCGMIGRLDPRTQSILVELLLAIVNIDAKRCSQLTLDLSESSQPVDLARLEIDFDRMLRKYYNISLSNINFSEAFYEILQVARNNKIKLPGNMGLYAKSLANLEGVARGFYPDVNLLDEFKPLMTDLFSRQLLGDDPLQTGLRIALDLKSLALQSPRQMEVILDRVSSETLQWNLKIRELSSVRKSLENSANRLAYSIVVGSLLIGAALIARNTPIPQLSIISAVLFGAATFLGFGLIVSIWRSGGQFK
ncbi:AarF/ABC1/UbiB kinase family protein [Spirulina major CS-329]|uniref:ABC1 kinase family protein n=1 Tax=Spirulina TaxID=1154 RepID=UPI000932C73A|nr:MULTISPECIES: AarF/ABC1/UbiB kinase family protein [Spirulina]MDB9496940.1 AarF/ABC1/UbiB kinase family protein [Spirulina subsalsa CS-330]MDB9504518.1 AarF/ABC1/UbiB kinase family protein [Spirulina major CS-329]